MSGLRIGDFQDEHEAFDDDVHHVFDWRASADSRDSDGGTSLRSVRNQLAGVAARLATLEEA